MPEPAKTKIRRPKRSRAGWSQIIERFDAGNDSPADFCRRENVSVSSFYQWRRRLPNAAPSGPCSMESLPSSVPRFIELDGLSPTQAGGWQVELDLGDGLVLRLRRG